MKQMPSLKLFVGGCLLILVSITTNIANATSQSEPNTNIFTSHGFALYGDLKYPQNFEHFDFVNPNATKGGTLRLMGFGTFDTLNPYTLKGISPFNSPGQFMYGFSELNETLMAGTGGYSRSGDEAQSAYGLIAESIRYPADIRWVEFTLRQEASFHDGHPIDAEDAVFSYQTLIEKGHPQYQQQFLNVKQVEAVDDRTVRFEFKEPNQRANVLRAGELPVLPKHFWEDKDFERSSDITPLLSGPYRIGKVDMGRRIELNRVSDFWSKDLGIYRGRYNFDLVSIDYYLDQSIAFEAFKSDEFDLFYDYTAKNWAKAYDFPALNSGDVIKTEITHQIPSGTQGFFFNSRRPLFKDRRVRQAIGLMFDYEWTNANLFNGAYQRSRTLYPNSEFSTQDTISDAEKALLASFQDALQASVFEDTLPISVTSGNGRIRDQIREAIRLMKAAGWELKNHKLTHSKTKEVMQFEILIRQKGIERVLQPFAKNLEKIGIDVSLRLVDASQYKVRLDEFDFDMTTHVLSQGLAPSFEQRHYFHSSTAGVKGSQNLAGVAHPVVDALLDRALSATTKEELIPAMKALDRVLLSEHYIVPNWHLNYHRLAYWNRFNRSLDTPYKLGTENWWKK